MTFLQLLEEYGVPHKTGGEHHHVTAGYVGIECPLCSPNSGKYKLGYNLSKGYATCWSCGYVNIVEALVEITGATYRELRSHLEVIKSVVVSPHQVRGKLTLPTALGPLLKVHRDYLCGRGFDPDHLETFYGLRGIGLCKQLAWCLFIPLYFNGRIVSWTTRRTGEEGVRYRAARSNEETLPGRSLLFADDFTKHTLIVCEGPFDAMKIGPGAVATMGMNVTKAQMRKIGRYPKRYIVFDNEAEAQKRAWKICNDLAVFPGKTRNILLNAKDAASASNREISCLRKLLK